MIEDAISVHSHEGSKVVKMYYLQIPEMRVVGCNEPAEEQSSIPDHSEMAQPASITYKMVRVKVTNFCGFNH